MLARRDNGDFVWTVEGKAFPKKSNKNRMVFIFSLEFDAVCARSLRSGSVKKLSQAEGYPPSKG